MSRAGLIISSGPCLLPSRDPRVGGKEVQNASAAYANACAQNQNTIKHAHAAVQSNNPVALLFQSHP